jgi:hypothetical protein
MKIVSISAYRARQTVQTLESLLRFAKRGDITGLAFAWRCIDGKLGHAVCGEFNADPIGAMGALSHLNYELCTRATDS